MYTSLVSAILLLLLLIAEISAEISMFSLSKHLYLCAGLIQQNDESASKKYSVHISCSCIYIA